MSRPVQLLILLALITKLYGGVPFQAIDTFAPGHTLILPSSPLQIDVLFIGSYDAVTNHNGAVSIAKPDNDFTGYIPINGRSDSGYIIVNHESNLRNSILGDGGGMTVFTAARDKVSGHWKVVNDSTGKYRNVDFSGVGGTYNNCGGIQTPWGTVLTGEEWILRDNKELFKNGKGVSDTTDFLVNDFNGQSIKRTIPRYQQYNWLVEVDVPGAKAIRKIYEAGRCSHESGAIMPDAKTIYICDDFIPGFLYKYVADAPGDLYKGSLFVYQQHPTGTGGTWLPVVMDIDSMISLHEVCARMGATMFIRTEWAVQHDGKVYFSETGTDDTGEELKIYAAKGAQLAYHLREIDKADGAEDLRLHDYYGRILELDTETGEISVFLQGGKGKNTDIHFAQPDCLNLTTIGGKTYMVIHEDINNESMGRVPAGITTKLNEIFWLDMSIPDPTVDDLVRFAVGPPGCETTGGRFTPDGDTYFFNVQHPGAENTFPYNYPCTVAVSGFHEFVKSMKAHTEIPVLTGFIDRIYHLNKKYKSVILYDESGRVLKNWRKTDSIDLKEIPSGTYWLGAGKGNLEKLILP